MALPFLFLGGRHTLSHDVKFGIRTACDDFGPCPAEKGVDPVGVGAVAQRADHEETGSWRVESMSGRGCGQSFWKIGNVGQEGGTSQARVLAVRGIANPAMGS